MTQKQAILAALKRGEVLTPMIALQRFNCYSLAQRISELCASGVNIKRGRCKTMSGKIVGEYRMVRK